MFSGEERIRIERRMGKAWRQLSLQCPLLTPSGTCSVYDIRPMICRVWGLTKSMACPFGCVPERWLTEDEAHALLAKAEEW
ncbi:MAG: hypothetical protein E6J01_03825 [Chloroflexi bacterium]|nr:MAG: hypothetical protein E6J01_03825 [Chloroflexota bacterium]